MDAPELEFRKMITSSVQVDLPKLAPYLRQWAEEHLVIPHKVTVSQNADELVVKAVWRVTDHIGRQDGSSRVVFDPESGHFGLSMELPNGVDWYMGPYGSFAEAVESI